MRRAKGRARSGMVAIHRP